MGEKMNLNKAVAQKELQVFGGIPKVIQYKSESESKVIDILTCVDVPQKGIKSCGTIGLNIVETH
jgi:hypothetical protein